jgi:hypothetical protein
MSKISPQGHFMKRLHGRRCAGASAGCPGEGVEAGQEGAQGRGRAEGPCGEIFDMRGPEEVVRHVQHISQPEASRASWQSAN